MKTQGLTGWSGALMTLAISGTVHAQEPTVRLTVASFDKLVEDAKLVASAIVPQFGPAMVDGFVAQSGVSTSGIDTSAPWVAEMWLEGTEPEGASIRFPVKDSEAFKTAVDGGSLLGGEPFREGEVQYGEGYATLVMGETPSLAEIGDAISDTLQLDFQMTDTMREMIQEGMDEGLGEIQDSIGEIEEADIQGMNPAAIVDLMGFYFEVVETAVNGLDSFSYALGVDDAGLLLNQSVVAKEGSELAGMMSSSGAPLGDLIAYDDPESDMFFAGSMGEGDGVTDLLMEYMEYGFAIMGGDGDSEPMMAKMQEWMEDLMPFSAGISYDFGEGMAFEAIYDLQGRASEGLVDDFMAASKDMIDAQSETFKMYKGLTFNEVEIEGLDVPATRVVLEMDLENPIFGGGEEVAAEFIENFFPGGKMTYDMVATGDQMLLATEGRIKRLLDVEPNAEGSNLLEGATGYARLNILGMLADMMAMNPVVPLEVKGMFSAMDREGTEIVLSAAPTENGARSRISIPFALIKTGGAFFVGMSQEQEIEL